LRFILDCRLLSISETGISRYSRELIDIYIKRFGAENVSVILKYGVDIDLPGLIVLRTNLSPFRLLYFYKFYFWLKQQEFDVYHSMFYSSVPFRIPNKTLITTVHDVMYRFVPHFFSKNKLVNYLAIKYFDFIVGQSLKNSDCIVSVSTTTENDVKRLFKQDSVVITEGVNVLKINTDTVLESLDPDLFLFHGYFLYVGNGRPHKNIDFMIRCYLGSATQKKLVIVGHKGQTSFDSEKGKTVIYPGYVSDELLSQLYENCSAFVFPSLYEGFGLPILEAIYRDSIVFSSNAGALKEFGTSNIHYFDPYDEARLINLFDTVDDLNFSSSDKELLLAKHNWQQVGIEVECLIRRAVKDKKQFIGQSI